MNIKTTRSRLTAYINAWNRYPNNGSYYLKKITKEVQKANESKAKRLERIKMKRVKKVVSILLKGN